MEPFYTLENLHLAAALAKPARLAVLGNPVAHSASPQMHQAAIDAHDIEASYVRLEVKIGQISTAFQMMSDMSFFGCNVTVPHKLEAMAACSEVSEQARLLGAVNTVVFRNGYSIGYNTDGPGFHNAIADSFGLKLSEIHTVILGAGGGAGQAIATQCALEKPAQLTLVNRDVAKLDDLRDRLTIISPETQIQVLSFHDKALKKFCLDANLLIQTTSVGLKKNDPALVPDDYFSSKTRIYDTIYQPPETKFLSSGVAAGCETDNGMSLLIHQGAIAFQHWFPNTNPLPFMRAAMNQS